MKMFYHSERGRGIIGYIIAIIIANSINILLSKHTSLTIEQSTFISMYVVGSLIVYSSDILIAKEKFYLDSYKGVKNFYGKVPHTDFYTRGQWLFNSLLDKYFFRFLITVIIDTVIGIALLKYSISSADKLKILPKWKYRNHLIVFIIAIFTYILYLSTLRFQWAYEKEENIILNIIIIGWVSIAILINSTTNYISFSDSRFKWRNLY